MKVAVECKSPLLQKSLEMLLAKYISSKKQCDIVVRDVKCLNDERCFYISSEKNSDLIKPFSKSQLLLALDNKYKKINGDTIEDDEEAEEPLNFDILEKRIEFLTAEYQKNILKAVKAFYEK
ncbi:MAG: hypothetical protein AUK54_01355 [Helicobacteraceae bacterium CG2_30_36_10]|nr:MAG: hypothetical protein AUK54_01355 [Helicobacteraceae bacterium CG2_30_36_10]